jgi:hypothetical protein
MYLYQYYNCPSPYFTKGLHSGVKELLRTSEQKWELERERERERESVWVFFLQNFNRKQSSFFPLRICCLYKGVCPS